MLVRATTDPGERSICAVRMTNVDPMAMMATIALEKPVRGERRAGEDEDEDEKRSGDLRPCDRCDRRARGGSCVHAATARDDASSMSRSCESSPPAAVCTIRPPRTTAT